MRRRASDVLTDPELADLLGGDFELVAIADAIAETRPIRSLPRRRTLLVAAAVVATVLLASVPALAALTSLIDFSDAPRAEGPVVWDFAELEQQAPPEMDPRVNAEEARRVDIPIAGSDTITVYLAPTRTDGFCLEIVDHTLGCDSHRTVPVEIGLSAPRLDGGPAVVYGWLHDPGASLVDVKTARGASQSTHPVRITAPINASIFVVRIDDVAKAFPIEVVVIDQTGNPIATRVIERPPS
jgi:hypothetical protein